jgi:hypothetical protein
MTLLINPEASDQITAFLHRLEIVVMHPQIMAADTTIGYCRKLMDNFILFAAINRLLIGISEQTKLKQLARDPRRDGIAITRQQFAENSGPH